MNSSFVHSAKLVLAALALTLLAGALSSLGAFNIDTLRAGAGDNVSGFAWADTIGWISFNCLSDPSVGQTGGDCVSSKNYGVTITDNGDGTGTFSGFAWNDAVGWIDFSGATIDFSSGEVSGTAQACGVFQSGCSVPLKNDNLLGDWNGEIRLRGTASDGLPSYGVIYDADSGSPTFEEFRGFAWGDPPVGWISFNCTNEGECGVSNYKVSYGADVVEAPLLPTVTLSAPESVESGTNADVAWTVRNATEGCTDTPDGWWDGDDAVAAGGGSAAGTVRDVGPITAETTYVLECINSAGAGDGFVTINVNPFIRLFTANGDPVGTTIFESESATLAWDTANTDSSTDSCDISPATGCAIDLSGMCSVSPEISTDYTLFCERDGNVFDTEDVRVNVTQSGFILEPDPQEISIISFGEEGVRGSGGESDRALFWIRADDTFSGLGHPVNLSVPETADADPFFSSDTVARGTDYNYKFRIVPVCDNDGDGKYEECSTEENPAGIVRDNALSVATSNFWNNFYGVEFWVESTAPLPPRSSNEIIIYGQEGGSETPATDTLTIILDSRLFDPEYREF